MPKVYNLPPDFTPKVGTKIELSEDPSLIATKKYQSEGS